MSANFTRRGVIGAGLGAFCLAAGAGVRYFALRGKPLPFKHVILLLVDALRADRLGCYGYKREIDGVSRSITPNIDALAERGALFEQAISQSNWTETSMASMFYSVNPVVTTDHHAFNYLPEPNRTLAVALDHGFSDQRLYTKIAIQANALLMSSPFTDLFDITRNLSRGPKVFKNHTTEPTKLLLHERADVLNSKAVELLDEAGDNNLLLYIHYMDVHETYSPVSRYARFVPDLPAYDYGQLAKDVRTRRGDKLVEKQIEHIYYDYDASLMFLDEQVGALLSELERLGIARDSLIILAADHGQSLGEHDTVGHGLNLYPEETHVPLIMAGKSIKPARVKTRVRNLDIFATVARYIGFGIQQHGESLYPLIEAASQSAFTQHREVFCCMDYPPNMAHLKKEMVISPAGIAYIVTSNKAMQPISQELYDITTDPAMETPLDNDGYRAGLKARLAEIKKTSFHRKVRPNLKSKYAEDNPVRREQLRALGYIN